MNAEAQKKIVVDALEDLKAVNIVTLDVTGLTDVMDFLIIASGTSSRHVKSLANSMAIKFRFSNVNGDEDATAIKGKLKTDISHTEYRLEFNYFF